MKSSSMVTAASACGAGGAAARIVLMSSQPSESPIDGKLQRSPHLQLLNLNSRPTGRQGQSTSRSSSRPKPDGSATARVDAASSQDTSYLDAEWTMNIQPDATVLIQHKRAPVLRAQHVTWAEKTKQTPDGKWVMSKFKAERVAGGQNILSGLVRDLNLQASGTIQRIASNELRFDYDFKAAKPYNGIMA